jgi:hypothetical protein
MKTDIINKFRKKEGKKLKPNPTRRELQKLTVYYLFEARRAIGLGYAERMMKNKEQYEEWMLNAIYLLQEADACRQEALKAPWRI